MEWFFGNPKIFNYVIMGLYLMNSGWWFWHRQVADGFYWLSALAITAYPLRADIEIAIREIMDGVT